MSNQYPESRYNRIRAWQQHFTQLTFHGYSDSEAAELADKAYEARLKTMRGKMRRPGRK